jgi:hypothetical protein
MVFHTFVIFMATHKAHKGWGVGISCFIEEEAKTWADGTSAKVTRSTEMGWTAPIDLLDPYTPEPEYAWRAASSNFLKYVLEHSPQVLHKSTVLQ